MTADVRAGDWVHFVLPHDMPGVPYGGECCAALVVRVIRADDRPTEAYGELIDLEWHASPHHAPSPQTLLHINGQPVQEPWVANSPVFNVPREVTPLQPGFWHHIGDCSREG